MFEDPNRPVPGLSRNDFTTVPLSTQARLTGQNTFELIDDDHDGFAEFLHVQIGVNTNRRNCTLDVSLDEPPDTRIGELDLLPDADGKTFSAYIEGSLLEHRAGELRFQLNRLRCGGQSLPLSGRTVVNTTLNGKFRRPFKIARSAPMNSSPHHVEYWIDCTASAPLRFPLFYSVAPGSGEGLMVKVEPETAPCAQHAFKLTIDTGDSLPVGNYNQVLQVHAPGGASWSGEELRFEWKVNEAPEVFGVNPSKGIGPKALFHVATTDRNGDIERVDLLINDTLREQGGCYVSYLHKVGSKNETDGIILHSDDARVDALTKLAGQAGVENERCSIAQGWTPLLRDVAIGFKPGFAGPKNVYVRAIDSFGASSGWKQVGTWTAGDEEAPEPISAEPYLGSGLRQRFNFAFSDINGSSDIQTAEILIQFGRDEVSACKITLDRDAAIVQLLGDTGTGASGTRRVNSQDAAIRNRQCAVSDVIVTNESRDALHLAMSIEFDRSFRGRRNIYARARDKAGLSSPWRWLGSWVVPEP
jgi:hypothetical protein